MGEYAVFVPDVAEFAEKLLQLVTAAVNVADDVEGTVLLFFVVPHLCADDLDVFKLFGAADDVDEAETLFFQTADAFAHGSALAVKHPFGHLPVGALFSPLHDERFGQVQHDSRSVNVVFPGKLDDFPAVTLLDVGRVHHRQPEIGKPLPSGVIQQVKGVRGHVLAVFVVAHHSPEEVGGKHFC